MLSPVILLVVLLSSWVAYSDASIFDDLFNPGLDKSPKFSDSQLYLLDGDNSVGLNDIQGYIGCFGDFNSDKYTDLFVVVGNGSDTRVDVFLWNRENWEFVNSSASIAVPFITNIAAGDFDYDGKLDLLVSGLINTTSVGTANGTTNGTSNGTTIINNTYVRIYQGLLNEFGPMIDEIYAASQVSIVNINNDPYLDLFGEIAVNATGTMELQRVFWINNPSHFGHFGAPVDFISKPNSAPLASLRSSAFVDIDGDCLADFFVVSKNSSTRNQYELLINGNKGNYNYSKNSGPTLLPLGAGQISFADFDKDGTTDFIIPVCYPWPNCTEANSIHIVLNKQKPLCSLLKTGPNCRSSTALCTADSNFHLGVSNSSDPYFAEVPLPAGDRFYFDEEKGRPLTVRVGDFNLDGYPDILIPIISQEGPSRMELWQNVPGSNGARRSFSKITGGVEALTGISDAYAGGFFDLDEDGVMDMFVLADNPPRIAALYNNFENDAFFLKALGLNGVCTEWCDSPSPKFPSPKPYGVNFVGAVFKFQYTDLSGKSQLATGTQLPQSSYLPLATPYTLFGLGRTSNYIEQFFFGVPSDKPHFSYWTGSTIPNSQVVAVPYKYDNKDKWTLELYITPSGLLFWIMIALVACVIILSIIVYVFYRKEKNEDRRKKKEQAHLFSFDAL